jgi:hypothetical protein
MSPPPSPLARKRELGVVLGSFHLHHLPRHHHHPLSLANASWGWSSVRFTRTTRHVTTTIPSRSQTRVGGGPQFVSLATPATSPPPSPLARKHELGVVFSSFHSQHPRHHHPLSLAIARWGYFLVLFTRDTHCVTTTTPILLATAGWGFVLLATAAASPPPPPLTRKHEVGVVTLYFNVLS